MSLILRNGWACRKMKESTKIKKLVQTAMRAMDDKGWNPGCGGEWRSPFSDVHVIFNPPTRYCVKASYRVISADLGIWTGYLNGVTHKNIGRPVQIMTAAQLKEEQSHRDLAEQERLEAQQQALMKALNKES